MEAGLLGKANKYIRRQKMKLCFKRVLFVLACFVVFGTTYMLILPAITMGEEYICGMEQHEHDRECYAHVVVHKHDKHCADTNGSMWCELPEVEEHIHTDECYVEGHEHIESCYEEQTECICELLEADGHIHTDECYECDLVINCTVTEPKLDCGKNEIKLHKHDENCYDGDKLCCEMMQIIAHQHDDGCERLDKDRVLTCEMEEHIHDENCVEQKKMLQMNSTARESNDLVTYLNANGGALNIILTTKDDEEIPRDANGNYIVLSNTEYKLSLNITAPDGIAPGLYQFQLPQGLEVLSSNGTFVLDDTQVSLGEWHIDENGLITFDFNENANSHTEVTITAQTGVKFILSDVTIVFDGNITVVVNKPTEEKQGTQLNKWGSQGDPEGNQEGKKDPNKIYWTIEIVGQKDSNIPGSVITDQLKDNANSNSYTQSDMEQGITFGASEPGGSNDYHEWVVYPGDPNLTWTEDGWTYTIPETVNCRFDHEQILGNEGWIYWVNYTSTPNAGDDARVVVYSNEVTIDNVWRDGYASVTHGSTSADVIKTGVFQGGADGGKFVWEVKATIPGKGTGSKPDYYWNLWDEMSVKNGEGNKIGITTNTIDLASVTAVYKGKTYTVPKIEDATEEDMFAWKSMYNANENGVYYARDALLFCRCNCTEETCAYWNDKCSPAYDWYNPNNFFCTCWNVDSEAEFTFTYATDGVELIEKFGGLGNKLYNQVALQKIVVLPEEKEQPRVEDSNHEEISIPGVFRKELTKDYEGYSANYEITVNEAKIELTDGSPLLIHDEMTPTLVYVNGSLVITAEDAEGKVSTLKEDTDYTVTYDGSGEHLDSTGNSVHVLDIIIKNPQPVMYTLDYDAALIIPDNTGGGIAYSNAASIELWGEDLTVESTEKIFADINIAAENYRVEIVKTANGDENQLLADAKFGLYNEHDGLVAKGKTDENGELVFETNVIEGIILYEHTPYYIQEMEAPEGYQLDKTKYWFYFCKETSECGYHSDIENIKKIPKDEIEIISINNNAYEYELPETGGAGTSMFYILGMLLIWGETILLAIKRRIRG